METTCLFQCVGPETCCVPVPNRERLRSRNRGPSISKPGEVFAGMGGGRVSHHAPAIGSEASQGSRLQRGGSTLPERLGVQTRWRQKFLPARQVTSLCRLHAHCGPSCGISLPRPSQPPSPRDKPEDERGEGDDDGRHLGGAGRRRSRGGAVCIWEHFLPWLPGASAVWLMIRKPPLDIPLFASYRLSHSTALKVKGSCGSLLCNRDPFLQPGRGLATHSQPQEKGCPGSVTGVWASELDRRPPPTRTQNMSDMCVTFYCSSGSSPSLINSSILLGGLTHPRWRPIPLGAQTLAVPSGSSGLTLWVQLLFPGQSVLWGRKHGFSFQFHGLVGPVASCQWGLGMWPST